MGWAPLLAPWTGLAPTDLAVLLLGTLASYGARAWRLYDYFHPTVAGAPWTVLRLSLLHNMFNNLLPMRTGEAALPLLMKRNFGTSYLHTGSSLLWLRVLDLGALALLAATVVVLGDTFAAGPRGLALIIALASLAGLLTLPWIARLLSADPKAGRLQALIHTIASSLPTSTAAYARAVLFTVIAWAGKGLAFVWLVLQFTSLEPAAAVVGVAAGELSSVLPIHGLAGSGTYEGAMVGALVSVGTGHDVALIAAVNVHLFLLGVAIAFGVLALALPRPSPSVSADRVS